MNKASSRSSIQLNTADLWELSVHFFASGRAPCRGENREMLGGGNLPGFASRSPAASGSVIGMFAQHQQDSPVRKARLLRIG